MLDADRNFHLRNGQRATLEGYPFMNMAPRVPGPYTKLIFRVPSRCLLWEEWPAVRPRSFDVRSISLWPLRHKLAESLPKSRLGPPVVPFYPFLGEGSPTRINDRKQGYPFLTSLLEDLVGRIEFHRLILRRRIIRSVAADMKTIYLQVPLEWEPRLGFVCVKIVIGVPRLVLL